MKSCRFTQELAIVKGDKSDYERLSRFHYRDGGCDVVVAIFALRATGRLGRQLDTPTAGVIVYTMPSVGCELRNIATADLFGGLDGSVRLSLINRNVRCISRVIIEPRLRGIGLAVKLVRETMPRMNVPIVEAMAVMGLANSFFEKAGMKAYTAPIPSRCVQLVEAFSLVGIEEAELIDPAGVQRKLDGLRWPKADFIEAQIRHFLQSYGKRRRSRPGIERIRFVLSRLTARPAYYIWLNPQRVSLALGRANDEGRETKDA